LNMTIIPILIKHLHDKKMSTISTFLSMDNHTCIPHTQRPQKHCELNKDLQINNKTQDVGDILTRLNYIWKT
jgi:hypothetical protein